FQQRAAEKTGRLDEENQQHDGEGRHLRQRRIDEGAQRDDLSDQEAGYESSLDAPQTADDHDHESECQQLDPHLGVHHDQRRMQAPGQPGQAAGDDEGDGEEPVHVDAESLDMLDVLDAGPDRLAYDRSVQEQPDADIDEQGDGDDNETIDGNSRSENVDPGSDRFGYRTG